MSSNYPIRYDVDIVLCLDVTMGTSLSLDMFKRNAHTLSEDLRRCISHRKGNTSINQLRMRVIAFRDYYYDREKTIIATDFLYLPEQSELLSDFFCGLNAEGGGDSPEDGLEALAFAIKSDWNMDYGDSKIRKRHIIVLFSDEVAHDLGFGKAAPNYPSWMPKDFDELSSWWSDEKVHGKIPERSKRLLLHVPYEGYWKTIADSWNNTILYECAWGNYGQTECALDLTNYNRLLEAIIHTI